jgi:hypothetical protein
VPWSNGSAARKADRLGPANRVQALRDRGPVHLPADHLDRASGLVVVGRQRSAAKEVVRPGGRPPGGIDPVQGGQEPGPSGGEAGQVIRCGDVRRLAGQPALLLVHLESIAGRTGQPDAQLCPEPKRPVVHAADVDRPDREVGPLRELVSHQRPHQRDIDRRNHPSIVEGAVVTSTQFLRAALVEGS